MTLGNTVSNSGIRLLLDFDFIQGDIPNRFCTTLLYFIMHKDYPETSYGMISVDRGVEQGAMQGISIICYSIYKLVLQTDTKDKINIFRLFLRWWLSSAQFDKWIYSQVI